METAEPPSARRAGVALPLFALRGQDDLGSGTILDLLPLIDWCRRWNLGAIQLLPMNESAPEEGSPYTTLSAFALDPSYISMLQVPEVARNPVARHWLATDKIRERIAGLRGASQRDRKLSYGLHVRLLEFAYGELRHHPIRERRAAFADFCTAQADWLDEYALFRALSERASFQHWESWPQELRSYGSAQSSRQAGLLVERIRFAKFVQWIAWEQWQQVRAHAHRQDVWLKGDMPFACASNSADVWAHPELFDRRSSAGTPPDAFSATGQIWGLPVYDWDEHRRTDFAWWRRRARQAKELYDLFRVDHVVGLYRTYAIAVQEGGPVGFVPADEATQRQQGHALLRALQQEAQPARVVAEDLGTIPDWVRDSLHALRIPGYKVLRWENDDGQFRDPRAYPAVSVATTGTHDTETVLEWWAHLDGAGRYQLGRMLGLHDPGAAAQQPLPWEPLLQRLLDAGSELAVLPIQDLLQTTERINVPATVGPHNWSYRLPVAVDQLATDPAVHRRLEHLRALIEASGRTVQDEPRRALG